MIIVEAIIVCASSELEEYIIYYINYMRVSMLNEDTRTMFFRYNILFFGVYYIPNHTIFDITHHVCARMHAHSNIFLRHTNPLLLLLQLLFEIYQTQIIFSIRNKSERFVSHCFITFYCLIYIRESFKSRQ
jgi:hypothetical protein